MNSDIEEENIDSIDEVEEKENLEKYERNGDDVEKQLEIAESIYNKLKSYVDFHGLNCLNVSSYICITGIIPYLSLE